MNCSSCLKVGLEGFCIKCRKELFDGKKVSHFLSFNSPYADGSNEFQKHTNKISISGVQVKCSLKLSGNSLELTEDGGEYILKPIPTGTFDYLNQAPANEHLTMQIAKQVYRLPTPPNALVFFGDKSPAYIVRRFDLTSEAKLQQEDFAQIAQVTSETHGKNYKYDLSYQEIAELIKTYIPTYRIELEKFFRLLIFNYVFSNGDAHLKNFSAIQSAQGDYVLTPVYDLLCTRIHSPNESDMALALFKHWFSEAFEKQGFYTYQDFYEFGLLMSIKAKRVEKMIQEFIEPKSMVSHLTEQSFLAQDLKHKYLSLYEEKVERLKIK